LVFLAVSFPLELLGIAQQNRENYVTRQIANISKESSFLINFPIKKAAAHMATSILKN
jgi:hypothetical protein